MQMTRLESYFYLYDLAIALNRRNPSKSLYETMKSLETNIKKLQLPQDQSNASKTSL